MLIHRFAVATSALTFILLLIGGLVHGTGSSLACPDWPLCFGSFFPDMKGNVLVEHGHRLVAASVGLLTVALAALLWLRERRLFWLGLLAVVLVCVQGLLGGLTVIYRLPTLVSSAHLSTSMLFFALLTGIACLTRRDPQRSSLSPLSRILLLGTTALCYVQISLGGLLRHTGGGLACVDLPLCRGRVLPLDEHPTVFIHALHRLTALLVLALVIALAARLYPALRTARPAVRTLVLSLPVLVLTQITLGVLSVLSFLGLFYVTAHLGVAALLLCALVSLCFLTRRSSQAAVMDLQLPGGVVDAVDTSKAVAM